MTQAPGPGWYQQQDGSSRYWNGTSWIDPATIEEPSSAGPQQNPYASPPPNLSGPNQFGTTQYGPNRYGANQYGTPAGYGLAGGHTPQGGLVAPKSPALSLLVSFFIPGVGSMMNGDTGKGIAILCGYVISWFLVIVVIGVFGLLGFWVWGMVDAYIGAQRWNARHGIIS